MADHDVIAGRYRVDDVLPDDIPGATTSTATDMILGRTVLVRLLPAGRPTLLDAARRAALVTDARLARVLDVGTLPDGRGYVINEQVSGTSLATMLQRGPVAAGLARSVVGETSAAIDIARRRGVHHLALRPSVVHIAQDGRVVLTGLAIDAALLDLHLADAEATGVDTEDLVRLLYAALTGRWPGRPDDLVRLGLPAAPTEGQGQWVPPASVLPGMGIPDDLDRLCRTLGAGRGPVTPADVVQALEPWAQIRVQSSSDAATVVQRPTAPAARPQPAAPAPAPPAATAVYPPPQPTAPAAPPVRPTQPVQPAATVVYPQPAAPARSAAPAPVQPAPVQPAPDRHRPAPAEPAAYRAQDRPAPQAQPGPAWLAQFEAQQARQAQPGGQGAPRWPGDGPTTAAPADATPRTNSAKRTYGESRSGQSGRFVLVGFAVVVLVAAVIGITAMLRPSGASSSSDGPPTTAADTTATASPTTTPTSSPTASPTASPTRQTSDTVAIASVTTYDPSGGHEKEELVGRIWDGDPMTSWTTFTYTKPNFGQLKDGVAIIVTLEEPTLVSSVTLSTAQNGGKVEIRATDPATKTGGAVLASGPVSSPSKTFTLKNPQRMGSFVIWLAELPQAPNGYVLAISELEIG